MFGGIIKKLLKFSLKINEYFEFKTFPINVNEVSNDVTNFF